MKERPILFSRPMVQAILEGRKTQTRRVLAERPRKDGAKLVPELLQEIGVGHACPVGTVGDRLWVKESVVFDRDAKCYVYAADGMERTVCPRFAPGGNADPDREADRPMLDRAGRGFVASIHMPRWASRITLEICEVRVQRLHEITEDEAKAEGIQWRTIRPGVTPAPMVVYGLGGDLDHAPNAIHAYRDLWDSINGKKHPWESNPWVWTITFRRLQP